MNPSEAESEAAGLYVHVPFCSAICPYCDFAVTRGGTGDRESFVEALLAEIRQHGDAEALPEATARTAGAPVGSGSAGDGGGENARRLPGDVDTAFFRDARFDTVYFGGGTPSALSLDQLGEIVGRLASTFSIAPGAEWTIEVNPEDADPGSLAGWRRLGFDRISLGVQALDNAALRRLGRRHDAAQARASVERARAAGFRSVSVDLIYSLPHLRGRTGARDRFPGPEAAHEDHGGRQEQSCRSPTALSSAGRGRGAGETASRTPDPNRWRRTLEEAAALAPDHLSCYELTVHDGTPFGRARDRQRLYEAGEDERAANFLLTHRRLAALGYEGYEVSNFARGVEHRSRHNTKYWRHAPYLGLGPSAHSLAGRRRWWNLAPWKAWREAVEGGSPPVAGAEHLTGDQLLLESVMLGLRQRSGVDCAALERRFGVNPAAAATDWIQSAAENGWLRAHGSRLKPTLEGMARADRLAMDWPRPQPGNA